MILIFHAHFHFPLLFLISVKWRLKKERDIAVILSSERYHELKRIEDILYGKAAELAIREGLISDQDANELLDNI